MDTLVELSGLKRFLKTNKMVSKQKWGMGRNCGGRNRSGLIKTHYNKLSNKEDTPHNNSGTQL